MLLEHFDLASSFAQVLQVLHLGQLVLLCCSLPLNLLRLVLQRFLKQLVCLFAQEGGDLVQLTELVFFLRNFVHGLAQFVLQGAVVGVVGDGEGAPLRVRLLLALVLQVA